MKNPIQLKKTNAQSREIGNWILIILIFFAGQLFVSLFLSLPWSPAVGGDSARYLDGTLEQGTVPYAGYIAVVWVVGLIGSPSSMIVVVQGILSVVAARGLLAVGTQMSSTVAGWIAVGWFLLFIELAQWTRYILTESMFFSVSALLVYFAVRPFKNEKFRVITLFGIGVLGSTLRPNGFILIGAVLTFVLIKYQPLFRTIAGIFLGWALLVISHVSVPLLRTHDSGSFEMRFLKGEVFWNQSDFQREMPTSNFQIDNMSDLFAYILGHPIDSLALFLSRVGWEMIQFRPWYTDHRNLYIILFMFIFYSSAIVGWMKMRGSDLNILVWSLTIPSILLIGMTWAIYDGRFAWWFLVAWIPWVAIGLEQVGEWTKGRICRTRLKSVTNSLGAEESL